MQIFVYGTLKKDKDSHFLLQEGYSKYIGEAILKGYKMYDLGEFPAIKKTINKNSKIYGEVYDIDKETLLDLDALESEGYLYDRIEEEITINDKKDKAYVYTFKKKINLPRKKIKSGNW